MIYLKNNTEIQAIYIPRQTVLGGGYIATTKTYEDGYRDGLEDGKGQQKDKLLNLYVTSNGQYKREDGWGVVTVDVPDLNGSYNEGYDNGYQDGYNQGQAECPEGGSCNLGIGEYGFYASDEGTYELYAENDGYDGWSKMFIHIYGGAIIVQRAADLLDNFNNGAYPDYGIKQYVGGIITEIQEVIQDCYKTYVLDNGLKIYRGGWFDGICFNDANKPINVGDYVIVYGAPQDNNGELIIEEGSQVIAYQECQGGSGLNIGEAETTLGIGTKWTRTASQFGLDAMSKIVIDGQDTVYWYRANEMFKLAQNQTPRGYNGYAIGAENSVWAINNYTADIDTDVEIWIRPEEYNREWGGYFGSQSYDDAPDSFQIRKQSLQNTFLFQFGTEVCSFDFTPNTWYRIRMNRYGVWVNGEQIRSWDIQEYTSNGLPLAINGIYNPEWDDTTNLFRSNRATYGYIYFYNSSILLAPCNNRTFAGNGLKGVVFRRGENPKLWIKSYYEGFGNLEDKSVTPSMADRDGNNLIVVEESVGYDGLSRVVINPQTIYNEGVTAGRAECVCPTAQEQSFNYDITAFTYKVYDWTSVNINKDNMTNDCNKRPIDCLLFRNRNGECTVMTKLDDCSGVVRLENGWNSNNVILSLKSNTITNFSSNSINSNQLTSIDTGFAKLEGNAITNCNALTDIKVTVDNNDLSNKFATNCFNGLPTVGTITIRKSGSVVTLTDDEITSFFRTIVGEGWTITIK